MVGELESGQIGASGHRYELPGSVNAGCSAGRDQTGEGPAGYFSLVHGQKRNEEVFGV